MWRPFLELTYCKSNVELEGQQKVKKRTVVEETVVEGLIVEGILVERSMNEKTGVKGPRAEDTIHKNWKFNNKVLLLFFGLILRTCMFQGVRNVHFSENFAYVLNG